MSHRTILVQAAYQTQANAAAKQIDPVGGDKTFSIGLSPSGAAPATHYWCGWLLTPAQETQLTNLLNQLPPGAWDQYLSSANSPDAILAARGLKLITVPSP